MRAIKSSNEFEIFVGHFLRVDRNESDLSKDILEFLKL